MGFNERYIEHTIAYIPAVRTYTLINLIVLASRVLHHKPWIPTSSHLDIIGMKNVESTQIGGATNVLKGGDTSSLWGTSSFSTEIGT